ncbi:MAG: AMP-binding protein [Desulfobulbaceae bacterium]|nr:AMP-binding protein [Desulfobulbaceae bacterium]
MEVNFNIVQLLAAVAERDPQRFALIMQVAGVEKGITFRELMQQVNACSRGLHQQGLRPGERAIVMIPMSIELYVVLLGIINLGAVAVFVDPWVSARQIAAFCAHAAPQAFIGIGKSHLLRLFRRELLVIPLTVTTGWNFGPFPARCRLEEILQTPTDGTPMEARTSEDPALITFTSGSSGMPKGANRTHGFLAAQYQVLSEELPGRKSRIDMVMFPVFALKNLAAGITSVIPDMDFKKVAEAPAAVILAQMQKHQVTSCTASPPFFDRLAARLAKESACSPGLKSIISGGAPVAEAQLRQWRRAFPDTAITLVYGSTEAEPVARIDLEERLACGQENGYCTGRISPRIQAKVITITKEPVTLRHDWAELELPPGEIGELVVTGAHVCKDYFNNPAAVRENKIRAPDGEVWHRMGDTGYLDAEGRFQLVGRVHSTIVRDRVNLHAQLLEQQAELLFPDAERIAAVGVADAKLGERLVLVVQISRQGRPPGDLAGRFAGNGMTVDQVMVTTHPLPLDPRHNSKIDYGALRRKIRDKELA